MSNPGSETAGTKSRPKKRLDPQDRERQIVDEAIRFFAEVGFEGQTRELAKRLGITQPLLYRYFPSKESLIERVYQETFFQRWQSRWDDLISDRSLPLEERLVRFYKEYTRAIFTYEQVRIFMLAGLAGGDLNRRYLAIVREKLLEPVCREMREISGLPGTDEIPLTEEEVHLATSMHGSIYYMGIRKWIYHLPFPDDLDLHVTRVVRSFMHGTPPTLREHFRDSYAVS
ncbi:TetR/AcrR family transcriptional regulator [Aquisalimonas sp.]|uniref:TetR/AcrR family transcriptional regulator n=1 Tax=unclassified Aquisalimonas TaxID=2644645 RepID=UPI0025BFCBAA|nr:TetR/AcrR family transcriptional regulator [Aquisalimonas sp.]